MISIRFPARPPTAAPRYPLVASAIGLVLGIPSMGIPSLSSAADSAASASDNGGELAEIVVTANRREENVLDVPYNISTVSGSALRDADVTDLAEISRLLPGVTVPDLGPRANSSNSLIIIRGLNVNNPVNSAYLPWGSVPTVSTYIDDVPLYPEAETRPRSSGRELVDDPGYSLTDAKLTANFSVLDVVNGSTYVIVTGNDGDRLPYVPRQTLTGDLAYTHALGGDMTFEAHANAAYRSSVTTQLNSSILGYQVLGGFTALNASAGMKFGSAWHARLFVDNLTNIQGVTSAGPLLRIYDDPRYRVQNVMRPRTIGARSRLSVQVAVSPQRPIAHRRRSRRHARWWPRRCDVGI